MPLENLTGNKYISDLNENWPAGTDLPDAGDDHIRGIKNVLKKTFPNVNGPITLTDEELQRGSVPAGSVTVFYQAAAPAGWSRTPNFGNTFGMRVVASASAGGGSGGSDDPILNDKVPSHTHTFSATSGGNSVDHVHGVSLTTGSENASHTHGVNDPGHAHSATIYQPRGTVNAGGERVGDLIQQTIGTNAAGTGISLTAQTANHQHAVNGNTGGANTTHTHAVSGTTVANVSAANWTPRYVDMIMCTKD